MRVALPLFRGALGLLLPFRTSIHSRGELRPLPTPSTGSQRRPGTRHSQRLKVKVPGCCLAHLRLRPHPAPCTPGGLWQPPVPCTLSRTVGRTGRGRAENPSNHTSHLPFCPQRGTPPPAIPVPRSSWPGAGGHAARAQVERIPQPFEGDKACQSIWPTGTSPSPRHASPTLLVPSANLGGEGN